MHHYQSTIRAQSAVDFDRVNNQRLLLKETSGGAHAHFNDLFKKTDEVREMHTDG